MFATPLLRHTAAVATLLLAACAQPSGSQPPPAAPSARPVLARGACAIAPPGVLAQQREIAAELNLARTQPRRYAGLVADYYATLGADRILRLGGAVILMNEGRPAVDEALNFLRTVDPLPPLVLDTCLSLAAQDHAADRGAVGGLGHVGSDGSQPSERAARRLGSPARCGENLGYGHESAREHVIGMIVDDGVPGRGHRRTLFDPRFRSLGVGVGPHSAYGTVAVELLCIGTAASPDAGR